MHAFALESILFADKARLLPCSHSAQGSCNAVSEQYGPSPGFIELMWGLAPHFPRSCVAPLGRRVATTLHGAP